MITSTFKIEAAFFSVYIVQCNDGTFYIGSTNNLTKRLHQHNHLKSAAHYTKIRRPVVLVYAENYKTLAEARKREAVLKRLSRKEKVALIEKFKGKDKLTLIEPVEVAAKL